MHKCFFSLVIIFGLLLGSPAQATKLVTYSIGGGGGDEARAGAVEGNYVIDLNRGYAFYLSDSGAGTSEAGDALVPPDLLRILQGPSAQPPLSWKNMINVLSSIFCFLSSSTMRPMPWSMQSIMAA